MDTINGFTGVSMEKIRSMVDSDTIIGTPISCGENTTVLPVSKISVGFATGGSDLPSRTSKEYFAGATGAGISLKPLGFLVVTGKDVKLVQMSMEADKENVVLNMIPEVMDKITALLKDKKKDKKEKKSKDTGKATTASEEERAVTSSEEKIPEED